MKFSDFVSKYDNYKGKGIIVTNTYCENDFARNIEILGLESHGGLQNVHIRNKNDICVPMFLPDIWFPKIDPESFNLNNEDIELLDLFEIKIGLEKESVENYLEGKNKFIKIFPYLAGDFNIDYIEPRKFNNFISSLLDAKPKKFEETKSEKSYFNTNLDKYFNTDFDKYFHDYFS